LQYIGRWIITHTHTHNKCLLHTNISTSKYCKFISN